MYRHICDMCEFTERDLRTRVLQSTKIEIFTTTRHVHQLSQSSHRYNRLTFQRFDREDRQEYIQTWMRSHQYQQVGHIVLFNYCCSCLSFQYSFPMLPHYSFPMLPHY